MICLRFDFQPWLPQACRHIIISKVASCQTYKIFCVSDANPTVFFTDANPTINIIELKESSGERMDIVFVKVLKTNTCPLSQSILYCSILCDIRVELRERVNIVGHKVYNYRVVNYSFRLNGR